MREFLLILATVAVAYAAGRAYRDRTDNMPPGSPTARVGACDLYARKGPQAQDVFTFVCPPGQPPRAAST